MSEQARRAWSVGDYARVAEVLRPASEAVVEAAGVAPGESVLDVAAGTGNLAIAAARAGATVVASDLTPELIELGRERTEAEGLDVRWREADAQALPFADAEFDCVASVFGAIFAPDPARATAEMFRVVRPGGRVAITAWAPRGWNGTFMRLLGQAAGMPDGAALPPDWGREEVLRDRLRPHASALEISELQVTWAAGSLEEMVAFIEEAVPPMVAARSVLDDGSYARVRDELRVALAADDVAGGDGFAAPAPYLLAVGRKAGH